MPPDSSAPVIPDFDTLLALYQHDEESFEALRRRLLQDALASAPADRRPRLERLLVCIEATRAAAGTPEQAASQAFEMMAQSLQELRQAWHQACHALSELQSHLLIEKIRH
jgi:hypothetical protein